MIVIKFGGTSVGDAERVARAVDIVAERRHLRPVIVVSALAGVTNDLIAASEAACAQQPRLAAEILRRVRARHEQVARGLAEPPSQFFETFIRRLDARLAEIETVFRDIALRGEITPQARAEVLSAGEQLSSLLFAYTMSSRALPGEHVPSEEVIWTDDHFCGATPDMDLTTRHAQRVLLPILDRDRIPVMGGFIGRSEAGATTTLGRNGSDYSAAVVGAAIGAEEVQIWTDVDGLLTCDPRLVPDARVIDRLSFAEAAELAQFGAKLHPRTLDPVSVADIPVRVLNTRNPASPGTLITRAGAAAAMGPRSIARKRGVTMLHATSNRMLGRRGFLAQLFEIAAQLGVAVDLIAASEVSVTVTLSAEARAVREELTRRLAGLADLDLCEEQCIIAVVGHNVMSDARTGARVLAALGGMPVKMMSLGRSGLTLSIVVDDANGDAAVKAMHRALFEA